MLGTIRLPKNLKNLNKGLLPGQRYKKGANSEGGSLSREVETATTNQEQSTVNLNYKLGNQKFSINVARARSKDQMKEKNESINNPPLTRHLNRGTADAAEDDNARGENGNFGRKRDSQIPPQLMTNSSKKTLKTQRLGLPPTPNKLPRDG